MSLRTIRRPPAALAGAVILVLIAGSGGFRPGFGPLAVNAQEARPDEDRAQPRLSTAECDQLYTHQLKVIQSDPDNPLYSSVQLNAKVLENPATREAEVRHCRTRVSRESYACQIKSDTLRALLECRRKFDQTQNTAQPTGQSIVQADERDESYFEDTSTDNPAGPNGGGGRPETMPSGRFTVNATNCARAYNHIYGVISKTESFQQRPDRTRLENYWRSGEARDSFAARCLTKFKPEDLGCLLSTRDADVLQGCLLVIPAG
ncbi:MAG: hypothetical protein RIF32_09380 [Leptospirales bacterium]|jgi:hypothetical protein